MFFSKLASLQRESASALSSVVESWPQNKSEGASGPPYFVSLLTLVHPPVLMDLPWPFLLISRSPWNFYQFLSSNVPRSSFLKLPEDPDKIPLPYSSPSYSFIVFLRNCLPYSFLFFTSFRSSRISYFPLSSAILLLPLYPLFFLSLCGLPAFSVSSRIYFFLVVSLSSRFTLAISFSSSLNRWFPTISSSDFLLLLLLRPRQGSRREITLINWSISKARSNSMRGYLRIYTLREGAQRRATMKLGI